MNFNFIKLKDYIWGQAFLEGETFSSFFVEQYLNTLHHTKIPFNQRFEKDDLDKTSEYSFSLLKALLNGWGELRYYFETKNTPKLSFNEIISLNSTLSSFEDYKPRDGVRSSPVYIGKSSYVPEPVLIPSVIEEESNLIWEDKNITELERSVKLFAYIAKTQIFYDGNKRTALLVSSFNLMMNNIATGIFISPAITNDFKKVLMDYYEDENKYEEFSSFLKENCFDYVKDFMETNEYKNIFKTKQRIIYKTM